MVNQNSFSKFMVKLLFENDIPKKFMMLRQFMMLSYSGELYPAILAVINALVLGSNRVQSCMAVQICLSVDSFMT
jgi:hypothetical protein